MLNEFLGDGGGGQPLRQAQAERLKPRGKFVSARRDILNTNVEGVAGQRCLAPVKSEAPQRRTGANRRGFDTNRGS